MNILAIETSGNSCSLAISLDSDVKQLHKYAPMQQAQLILPMINELLSNANLSINQLDAIAFGCGPGSFTGIRIATSIAQGLGFALKIPLIPVSSLAALAQQSYMDLSWKKLLVAIDARINEIYWGHYEVNSNGLVELQGEEKVSAPDDMRIESRDYYAVGNAWEAYKNKLPSALTADSTREATATGILELAKAKFIKKDWVKPENALPVYLRNEVAVKAKKG